MRLMSFLRLVLIGTVTAALALAQEPVYTIRVDVPIVSIDVAVYNSANQPVMSLGVDDFSIYEDGVLQQIRNFSAAVTPYNMLLLFDRSGSTESRWPLMQAAV